MLFFGVPIWLALLILVPIIGFGVSLLFLILLITKTPATTFLKASFGKRNIIINPKENGYLSFEAGKPFSGLSYVKNKGFYETHPSDRYIEAKSKVPCFINYGRFAFSVSPLFALIAKKLKEMGIKNWVQLKRKYDSGELKGKDLELWSTPISFDHVLEIVSRSGIKDWSGPIQILGKSVSFDHIVDYFGRNERADLIEAEIARRTAAETASRMKGPSDIVKWVVILAIIMIVGALAYAIVTSAGGGAASGAAKVVTSAAHTLSGTATAVK